MNKEVKNVFSFKRCISSLLCAAVLAGIVPGTVSAETNVSVSSSFRESGMLNSFWSPSLSYEEKTEADNLFSSPEETVIFEESEESVTLKLPADAEQQPLQFTATYINPLYADVITEEDLVQPSGIALAAEVEYHTTVASAGSAVREQMVSRMQTVTVGYCMSSWSNEDFSIACHNIFEEAIKHTGRPKEGDTLRWQYGGWDAEGGAHISDNTYYAIISFTPTYYTTAEQEEVMDSAVEELKAELNLDGCSDYKIVKSVYDWLCANISYDYDETHVPIRHTAYAGLINRTCVCQGYAVLMYRMMLECGIDCRVIVGLGGTPGDNGNHAWNIVELNNVYYNLDATWDAGMNPESYGWFLLNEESFSNHERDVCYDEDGELFAYGYYNTEAFHAEYPMAEENYFSGDEIRTEGILDEENNITWTLSMDGTLTISGEGAMPNFDQDGYVSPEYLPWNHLRGNITKIVVEPGITSLGIGAFMASENAVSAEIADTITAIDQYAFADCSSLTEICFFGNAPQISSNTFTGVTASAYYPTANTTWTDAVLQNYGGTITWEVLDSFEISTADDLFLFAELVNRGHNSMNGVLLNDITVNENVLNADGNLCADPSELIEWTPIGSLSRPYLGTFNGGGYTVSGLYFDDTTEERVGFFGRAGNKESNTYYGLIRNLTVADSYFSAKSSVGGIAGANGGAQIQNCFNSSTIAARQGHSGGIAGYCSGPVTNCENTGAVRGSAQTGGITGSIYESYIRYCNNTAPVTGTDSVGGIVGYKATYSTVEYCTNSGAIGGTTSVGGIVGDNRVDSISNCANYGSITGSSKTGGIVGNVYYGNVQNCFDNAAGSIIGYNSNGSASANYYLAETETDSFGGTTAVTFAQCRSGEVAFLLGSAWGQTIGEEDFPVLGGAKVYAAADGSPCPGYTNSADGIREHEFEDGVCRWCGAPEFTADNYDVNGDGELTEADALCLLRHTILPDRYPLAVDNADFDGDGSVTAGDAVSLLNSIGNITAP